MVRATLQKERIMKSSPLILALALTLSSGCNGHNGATVQTTPATVNEAKVALPNAKDSFKFLVLGDWGTGELPQYDLGQQMVKLRERFAYDTVITVGDNLYGRQRPSDFERKFEKPYKQLLDDGVKFYATLGNHDLREQPNYKEFNMDGKLYYTVEAPTQSIRFFMLDSNYPSPEQLKWLEDELQKSDKEWKIAAFHHPVYSSGGRHGSDMKLREILEELFVKYGVSVVFQGHDHFYERIKPQKGIIYFVAGSGGKLSSGDIDESSGLTDAGYDAGLAFLAVEIRGDQMHFNAITTNGGVVDSGVIERRIPVAAQ
jgi:hypothetical protein